MRNLKKILALVLALVMSMSLLTVANAFEDDADINEAYQEAAEVLAGLKVLQGRPDGSFDPKANVNRGEMAAIIYRMVTTDVEDKQTSIYAESSKLTDVPGTWSAGYVGFCNNSNLIMGYPDGTFQQNKTVTGHEALAMLLRAIGYGKNGEFVGKDWAINTAIYAKMNGLLKNINESTLSQPATREMVAEMAFRALLAENVDWSLGLNYQPNGKTLADGFNLKAFEGVITANQYADIYGAYGVDENETVLNDETSYEWATDLTQIGMNYRGWSCGKNNTVIFNEVTGNTVFETGAATTITPSKIDGIRLNDETEYLRNFDGDDNYTSDYRLEYALAGLKFQATIGTGAGEYADADAADKAAAAFFAKYGEDAPAAVVSGSTRTYTIAGDIGREIAPGKAIDAVDIACMKLIFSEADKEASASFELGEVYYGTKSVVGEDDISDELSWKEFDKKFLNDPSNFTEIDKTVNGDWLKVIDNDGDGYADYVFVTEFVMEQVVELTKKGVLFLTGPTANGTVFGSSTTEPYVCSTELAEGDIVLYAVIDGVSYVELAPSFTGEVDKYQYKNDVLVVDEVEYSESGIAEHTDYQNELEEANKETEYTYYQDHFDFIRIFALPVDEAAGLTLLTDAYFETKRTENIYAVKAFLDGEIKDVDVANNNAEFIWDLNDDNGWDKLNDFGVYNSAATGTPEYDRYLTADRAADDFVESNLAFYAMNDDGEMVLTSGKTYSYDKKGNIDGIKTDYVDLDDVDLAAGQNRYNGTYEVAKEDLTTTNTPKYVTDNGDVIVETNAKTVFYYVYEDARGNAHVKSVTGFQNALPVKDEISNILSVYAVATNVDSDADNDNYWLANAIVVETEFPVYGSANDVVLGYEMDNKTYRDFGGMDAILGNAKLETLNIVSVNGEDDLADIDYDIIDADGTIKTPFFYTNTLVTEENDSFINAIEKDFSDFGIYAAKVDRKVAIGDYITSKDSAGTPASLFVTADTVVYDLEWNSNAKKYVVCESEDNQGRPLWFTKDEHYIFYTNSKNQIIYAVLVEDDAAKNVTASSDDILGTLYNLIWNDCNAVDPSILSADVTIKGVDANVKAGETVTVKLSATQAKASVDDWNVVVNDATSHLTVDMYDGTTHTSEPVGSPVAVTGGVKFNDLVQAVIADGTVYTFVVANATQAVTYRVKVEVASAQNNTDVNSVTVKGQTATWNTTTSQYEVTLTSAQAADTTKFQMEVDTPAVANSTVGGLSAGTTGIVDIGVNKTTAVTSGTATFTVTPEDGSAAKTYTVKVTVDSTGDATMTATGGTGADVSGYDWNTCAGQGYLWNAGSAFKFTAKSTDPDYYVSKVTYTVAGEAPVTLGTEAGDYTIPASAMATAAGKTVTITVETTAFIKVTAASSKVVSLENADGTYTVIDNSTGIGVKTGDTIIIKVPQNSSVSVNTPANCGTISERPSVDDLGNDFYRIENITGAIEITY